jgi:hypothetical protein
MNAVQPLDLESPTPPAAPLAAPQTAPAEGPAPTENPAAAVDRTLYLLGRPKLKDFLRYVRRHAVQPDDEETLIGEWEEAKARLAALAKQEGGPPDHPSIRRIEPDETFEPLLVEFLKDPVVRHSFNAVPSEVAWVRLDDLLVHQLHIDVTHVAKVQQRVGPAPSAQDLFRLCLPYDHPKPPAKWTRLDSSSYVFISASNDLRFLGATPLKPEDVPGHSRSGTLLGMIGLAVGFGSNFLNAIHIENRLILNNGSHRAYALRDLGITEVPCLVQHVSSRDELDLVGAPDDVTDEPNDYLRAPRPPMFKDYFNPELRKVFASQRLHRQVRVSFSVKEHYVPAL